MNFTDVKVWIKSCEGLKLHPYMDTTKHVTIGWGRNLDNGISLDEAQLMFENDFTRCHKELNCCDWFLNQPSNVQNGLLNMNFNLGITELDDFKGMIQALRNKDYTKAAQEALNSIWAKQVGERAKDVAVMIREGNAST